MYNENEPLTWLQISNFSLWIFTEPGFDPMNYYFFLTKKIPISNIKIYQNLKQKNDFFLVFNSPFWKELKIVTTTDEVLYPKYFFKKESVSKVYFIKKNSFNLSWYTLLFEESNQDSNFLKENLKQKKTNASHVQAYSNLKTYTQKLEYIEAHSLQDQLATLIQNVNILNYIKKQASQEKLNQKEDKVIVTSLPEVVTTLPEVETSLPEVEITLPEVVTTLPEVVTTLPEVETSLNPSLVIHVLETGDTSNPNFIKEMTEGKHEDFIREVIEKNLSDKLNKQNWVRTNYFFKHFAQKVGLKPSSYWKNKSNWALIETYPFFCDREKKKWKELYNLSVEKFRKKKG